MNGKRGPHPERRNLGCCMKLRGYRLPCVLASRRKRTGVLRCGRQDSRGVRLTSTPQDYVMRCISVERRGLACVSCNEARRERYRAARQAGKLPCSATALPVEGRRASVFRHTLVTVEAPALRSSLQRKGDHRCQQGLQGWVQGRASAAELRKNVCDSLSFFFKL